MTDTKAAWLGRVEAVGTGLLDSSTEEITRLIEEAPADLRNTRQCGYLEGVRDAAEHWRSQLAMAQAAGIAIPV